MTQKGEIVDRLQAKATSIGKILANIEKKYKQDDDDDLARMKKSPSNLSTREKRASLRIAEIPAFNPKTIKKSPMTEAQPSTSSAAAASEEVTSPAQVEATITLSVDPDENKDDDQADPAE